MATPADTDALKCIVGISICLIAPQFDRQITTNTGDVRHNFKRIRELHTRRAPSAANSCLSLTDGPLYSHHHVTSPKSKVGQKGSLNYSVGAPDHLILNSLFILTSAYLHRRCTHAFFFYSTLP